MRVLFARSLATKLDWNNFKCNILDESDGVQTEWLKNACSHPVPKVSVELGDNDEGTDECSH